MVLDANAAVRAEAAGGAGRAVLSVVTARQDLAAGRLVEVPIADLDLRRRLHAERIGARRPTGAADLLLRIAMGGAHQSPPAPWHRPRSTRHDHPSVLVRHQSTGGRRAGRVVFVCTANSARSPPAQALWADRSDLPAASAGTEPAGEVHPGAVAAARRHGLTLAGTGTRHIDQLLRPGDLVIAVCDHAHEHAGTRDAAWLHWAVPDPTPRVPAATRRSTPPSRS